MIEPLCDWLCAPLIPSYFHLVLCLGHQLRSWCPHHKGIEVEDGEHGGHQECQRTGHRSELKSTHCGALLVSTVRCFNGRAPKIIRQAK